MASPTAFFLTAPVYQEVTNSSTDWMEMVLYSVPRKALYKFNELLLLIIVYMYLFHILTHVLSVQLVKEAAEHDVYFNLIITT